MAQSNSQLLHYPGLRLMLNIKHMKVDIDI